MRYMKMKSQEMVPTVGSQEATAVEAPIVVPDVQLPTTIVVTPANVAQPPPRFVAPQPPMIVAPTLQQIQGNQAFIAGQPQCNAVYIPYPIALQQAPPPAPTKH